MEKFLSGDGWGLSIVMVLGLAFFVGMVWVAIHSNRFKQMVREEEGIREEDVDG